MRPERRWWDPAVKEARLLRWSMEANAKPTLAQASAAQLRFIFFSI